MKQSSLLEVLETVLVVTVITALIWLYAEGETINTQTRTVKVRLVPPTAGLVVSTPGQASSETGVVELSTEVTIQASRGDWPRIAEWVRRETVDIEVPDPGSALSKEQQINLREALNLSALTDVNAFVKEVDPPNVSVRIQQLQDVPMGIRVEQGDLEISDVAPPTPKQERVTVTMPAEAAQMVQDQNLKLIARLDQLDPSTLDEDTQENPSVVLDLPPELQDMPFVKLNQERVVVTFIVRKVTEQIDLPRVQVRLRISDDITGRYQIRIDPENQRILRVTLRGPSEVMDRIGQDDSLVYASIQIKLADLTREDNHNAPLEIHVPEGVKVVATEPALSTITYTATPLADQP